MEDAEVICKQLSCGSARSVERAIRFGSGSGQIWLDDVNCRLHDTLLWQCPSSPWGQHNCNHQEDVGVICSELNPGKMHGDGARKKSNMEPVSEDFGLRLAAGLNNCSGRVEIFFRGMWGTVCDDSWHRHDAAVVCRQLNCGEPVWTEGQTLFDQASGTIWMDKVQCKGSELFLTDCQLSAMGDHDCEDKEDVNVMCAANSNRQYDTTGLPNPVYEEIEVQEHRAGAGAGLHSTSSLNSLENSPESELHEYEDANMEALTIQLSSENASVEIANKKELRPPRLVGQYAPCIGNLEVYHRGQWKSVCSSRWDSAAGKVVCKQTGCDSYHTTSENPIPQETGPVLLDKIQCKGTESSLSECTFSPSGQQKCETGMSVVIFCKVKQNVFLEDGGSPCAGRVQARSFGSWIIICGRMWDMNDARVVCKYLGCGDAVSASGNSQFGGGIWLVLNYEVGCNGSEEDPWKCELKQLAHSNCSGETEGAGVICSGEDWQLRLANGESICEGRVEVYYDGVWRRVVDTEWNLNEAEVVCRQLKCGSAINIYNHLKFGKGTGPTWISNVGCNGSEPFLRNCSFRKIEQSPFVDDVGVVCSDNIQIRLVDGGSRCAGRVELYYNGSWGTVCDDSWDLADAQVVCNQLKCGQALNATVSSWFGPGVGPIWLDNVDCNMKDSVLWECLLGQWNKSDCNHKEDAGVICSDHRAVRLQDGVNPCQGRVEVYYNRTWGTVCADSFGKKEAEVVCQQLSCGSAQSVESAITFGSGSGQIWLDDVNCRLHDTLLWQCPSSPWGQHNCGHKEDVGVICSELRLAAGFNNCSGRVEIFFNGTWGTICDDSWDKQDAAVVCRQLNCGHPMLALEEVLLDGGNGTIWIDEVKCKGSELFLWDCRLSIMGDRGCQHKEDVKLICSGHQKFTESFNQQRSSVFFIPCILVILLIAVSLALAAELLRSFQKDSRRTQCSLKNFSDPVYEEIEIHNTGASPDLHSSSSLNKLEYYTDSELHQDDDIHVQISAIDSFVQPFSQNGTVERVNDKELNGLELIGPEAPCIGRLQVRYRGRRGSVCSSPWDSSTGEVVCRQIGCNVYHATLAIPISQETGPILLDKVHCNGTESSLWECPFSASDQQGCETGTAVGYFCKGICVVDN
ncbi:deleted in malignant brain tumors 1 protein [Stegostoma tigrinum]|uniref:deleted in malignant brain tumors 1 protein n=1 Tax=Stegostoma tigrinum TaxID=3053191 RepID=UPI00286FEDD6|nr:deleted in malignant brain tumors 1 protein [Stegostoma tigrinum]